MHNSPHHAVTDTEGFSQTAKAQAGSAKLFEPNDLAFSQLVVRHSLANGFSAFANAISIIVSSSAEPKMDWVDASAIVPVGTIVKDAFSFGHRAVMENPRGNMGANRAGTVFRSSPAQVPVAAGFTPCPKPTSGRFLDLRPKSREEAWRKTLCSKVLGRNLNRHRLCVRYGLLALPDAFIFSPVIN